MTVGGASPPVFSPRSGGGMVTLRADARTLLDLLCLAEPMAAELDRVFRLRPGWGATIDALRMKGLVAMDSLRPSASALADFAARSDPSNDTGDTPRPAVAALCDTIRRLRVNARHRDWTPEEDDRLRRAYRDSEDLRGVAAELGRPIKGLRSRGCKIGLGGTHAKGRGGWATEPEWTEAEDQRLREAYGDVPIDRLAAELGREKGAVYQRANRLGLSRSRYLRAWSEDEIRALEIAHRRGLALGDLPAALGRKYPGVAKYAAGRDLQFGLRPRLAEPIDLAGILALDDESVPLPAMRSRPQPAPRPKATAGPRGWADPRRREAFLEALRESGVIAPALRAIGLSPASTVRVAELRAEDPLFDRQCEESIEHRRRLRAVVQAVAAFARGVMAKPKHERARKPRPRRSKGKVVVPAPAPPAPAPARPKPGAILTRAGATFASFHGEVATAPRPRRTDAEICAERLRYLEERKRVEAIERGSRLLTIEEAKLTLQRRGFSVCRADVVGGSPDRWAVGGLGKDVTDEQLVERARRVMA